MRKNEAPQLTPKVARLKTNLDSHSYERMGSATAILEQHVEVANSGFELLSSFGEHRKPSRRSDDGKPTTFPGSEIQRECDTRRALRENPKPSLRSPHLRALFPSFVALEAFMLHLSK